MQPTIIWGISADDWRTISIVAQGVLMLFLVVTGAYQLLTIRAQAKRSTTLETCNQWVSNAALSTCLRRLSDARISGELKKNPLDYRADIFHILNYLDGIATGIEEKVYDEKLTYKYYKWVVHFYVQCYLTQDMPQKINIQLQTFESLLALNRRWGDPTDASSEENRQNWYNYIANNRSN